MTLNPFRWRLAHLVEVVLLVPAGMAIGSIIGYVAEALGAESIGYWMWGKWPFDLREANTGSFWWLIGGGVTGAVIGYAYRLARSRPTSL